jgi:hypothetical protein
MTKKQIFRFRYKLQSLCLSSGKFLIRDRTLLLKKRHHKFIEVSRAILSLKGKVMQMIAHRSKTVVQSAKLAYLGKDKVIAVGTFKEVRALQLIFGIKGSRWSNRGSPEYIQDSSCSSWVWPTNNEIPSSLLVVDSGAYWKNN